MNIMGFYIIGMGLLMIFVTEIMFMSNFGVYTGTTYEQYFASNKVFAEIFILQKKVMGFMISGVGVLVLFIVRISKRRKMGLVCIADCWMLSMGDIHWI